MGAAGCVTRFTTSVAPQVMDQNPIMVDTRQTLSRKTALNLNNKRNYVHKVWRGCSKGEAFELGHKGLSKKGSKEIVTGKRRKK